MDVVKITINSIDYVISRNTSYSIIEYCKKAGVEMVKGNIPDIQRRLCLNLPNFVEILNGGRARVSQFDFTPGEWQEVAPPEERHFRNPQERAAAIKTFIKETLESEGRISTNQILGVFSGLSIGTLRRHIRDTVAAEGIEALRINPDLYEIERS